MHQTRISRWAQQCLAWHVKPSDAQNLDFLDGLRGLAVLMVVACHFIYTNPTSGYLVHYIGAIFLQGGMGVALFFSLSGFLVSLPFWKRKKAGAGPVIPDGYVRRRIIKIYPPLALMVLLFTPIYILVNQDLSYLKPAAEWLTGLPVFFPVDGRFNPVLWTLTVEVQFYITLPIAMWLFRHVSLARAVWLLPLSLYLVAELAYAAFGRYGIHGTLSPDVFSPLFSGLDMFVLGVLVSGLYTRGQMTQATARLGYVGIAALVIVVPMVAYLALAGRWVSPVHDLTDLTERIAFGCLLCFVGAPACTGARLLSHPLLRWFGLVSYEWYLFHQAVFIWIREAVGQAGGNPLLYLLIVGGSFVVSLLMAALTYRFFSLPILMAGRKNQQGRGVSHRGGKS